MKKLLVVLMVLVFGSVGGEKIFGFEKNAHAKIYMNGLEMQSNDFSLMKGFVYEAIQHPSFDDAAKARCAEVLVWATKKLVSKETHDLTTGGGANGRLFRAIVADIGTYLGSGKIPNKEKRKKMNQWREIGKKVVVRFIKISVKSKSTGKTITKVEWEISIPKITQTKGKKKK